VGDRHFHGTRVLFCWLLVLSQEKGWRSTIIRGLALVALLLNVPQFHLKPSKDYCWSSYCDKLDKAEAVTVPTLPASWMMNYPGRNKWR
jgi:hypothetical protein